MKTRLFNFFAIGLASSLSLGVFDTRADLEVSASVSIHAQADFYTPLATHGAWVEVGSYGRCWRPSSVAVEWRPYSSGHWVWTDCGWYWQSDEPWAWACYHYGSWVYDPTHSWIWLPGIEWAPAWVTWRVGGGYIGWGPLSPPGVTVSVSAPLFVFVETTRFHEPIRPTTVIVNNTTIINKTTVINNSIKRETRTIAGSGSQKVVVNEGPGVDVVQKATGKKIASTPIQEVVRKTPAPAGISSGAGESKGKAKPSATPSAEQPKSAPERKLTPAERKEQPAKPTSPDLDKGKKPEKENPSFAPPEEPRLKPEPRETPREGRVQPARPAPPKEGIAPAPARPGPTSPPTRPAPPAKEGPKPSKEKGEGPDKDEKR